MILRVGIEFAVSGSALFFGKFRFEGAHVLRETAARLYLPSIFFKRADDPRRELDVHVRDRKKNRSLLPVSGPWSTSVGVRDHVGLPGKIQSDHPGFEGYLFHDGPGTPISTFTTNTISRDYVVP